MAVVADASITAALLLPDEVAATRTYRSALFSSELLVPGIWWFEIRNVLLLAERRGRLTIEELAEALLSLAGLDVAIDDEPDEGWILDLARSRRMTVYDASYLELARRRNLPLATLDGGMIRAAKAADISLFARSA